MRVYDPRIGKFLSVDPLTKKYPELTPYQFASNRVIEGVDMDGLEFAWAIDLWNKAKSNGESAIKIIKENYVKAEPYINAFGRGLEKVASNLAPIRPTEEGDPQTIREAFTRLKDIPSNIANLPSQLKEVYQKGTAEQKIETTVDVLGTIAGLLKGKPTNVEGLALAGMDLGATWKSVKAFGHTFLEHGATKSIESLADRARNLKNVTFVGQWLDNTKAADFIKSIYNDLKDGENIVNIPAGLGRVVKADRTTMEATKAIIIIIKNTEGATNAVKTAYPTL